MKHGYFFILLLCAFLSGNVQPKVHPATATTFQEKASCTASCHIEFDADAAIQAPAGSHITLKKPAEFLTGTSRITQYSIFYVQSAPAAVSPIYAKSYISHIYPSLHYW